MMNDEFRRRGSSTSAGVPPSPTRTRGATTSRSPPGKLSLSCHSSCHSCHSPTGAKSPPGCEPNNEASLSPCEEFINRRPLISASPQVHPRRYIKERLKQTSTKLRSETSLSTCEEFINRQPLISASQPRLRYIQSCQHQPFKKIYKGESKANNDQTKPSFV